MSLSRSIRATLISLACLCLSVAEPVAVPASPGLEAEPTSAVYWSRDLEDQMPPLLFNRDSGDEFAAGARTKRVVHLLSGCGRMKNRFVVFEDGSKACCRYRDTLNDLRGDLYAYYFNSLLGLWNTPPVTVATVDFASAQWSDVVVEAKEAGWKDGGHLIMSLFVDKLKEEYIPSLLRKEDANLTGEAVVNYTTEEKVHLMQWSDMIVFDFLAGHMDRVFNNLINLQWNSQMMDKVVHNLERTNSGTLILLDNESTFWMGYLSGRKKQSNYALQIYFLERTCLFRKQTVDAVNTLLTSGKPDIVVEEYINSHDPLSFETMPRLNAREREEFRLRLEIVMNRFHHCEHLAA